MKYLKYFCSFLLGEFWVWLFWFCFCFFFGGIGVLLLLVGLVLLIFFFFLFCGAFCKRWYVFFMESPLFFFLGFFCHGFYAPLHFKENLSRYKYHLYKRPSIRLRISKHLEFWWTNNQIQAMWASNPNSLWTICLLRLWLLKSKLHFRKHWTLVHGEKRSYLLLPSTVNNYYHSKQIPNYSELNVHPFPLEFPKWESPSLNKH